MAVIFVAMNVVRFFQLSIAGEIHYEFLEKIWWTIFQILAFVYLGYHVHLKISENFFKKMVGAMTLFSGIVFLFK
jgi:uncharacterized membrane protein YfcA